MRHDDDDVDVPRASAYGQQPCTAAAVLSREMRLAWPAVWHAAVEFSERKRMTIQPDTQYDAEQAQGT